VSVWYWYGVGMVLLWFLVWYWYTGCSIMKPPMGAVQFKTAREVILLGVGVFRLFLACAKSAGYEFFLI